MQTTKEIGDDAEALAADYLTGQGYEVIERNYRTRGGEVDIIALDGDTLCFIEVKKKGSGRYGSSGEMITHRKLDRIRRTAEWYFQEAEMDDVPWRIDAVLIDGSVIELVWNVGA